VKDSEEIMCKLSNLFSITRSPHLVCHLVFWTEHNVLEAGSVSVLSMGGTYSAGSTRKGQSHSLPKCTDCDHLFLTDPVSETLYSV
jgi:hypothetical protein